MPRAASHPQGSAPPPPPAEFPLLAYADGLMEALRRHVPRALGEFDTEAVHQARVATRRLKAALDLMRPVIAGKHRRPLARALRKLRRRLGPLRDADVMLEHLGELAAAPRCAAPANWLADEVRRQRIAVREASAREASSAEVLERLGAWLPVRQDILRAGGAAGLLLAESVHRQLDDFARQADLIATPQAAPAPAARPNPHDLRIAGKALRYTLEMAVVQGQELPKKVMSTFKQMQEALGAWHDFVVLTDQALRSALDTQLGHHDAALHEQVLDLARFTTRRSGQHLDAFRRLWSARGVELAAGIRATMQLPPGDAGGRGVSVSGSRTGPGPNGSAGPADPAASPPAAPSAAS